MDQICEDCGASGATLETCPYAEEIQEKIVKVLLCDSCYKERLTDI